MNNCKWLSDEYLHICCNAHCREHVADACPYDKDELEECRFYEEEK